MILANGLKHFTENKDESGGGGGGCRTIPADAAAGAAGNRALFNIVMFYKTGCLKVIFVLKLCELRLMNELLLEIRQ